MSTFQSSWHKISSKSVTDVPHGPNSFDMELAVPFGGHWNIQYKWKVTTLILSKFCHKQLSANKNVQIANQRLFWITLPLWDLSQFIEFGELGGSHLTLV